MSDCSLVRSLLLSWVDEKLPEDQQGQVAGHLGSCGACAALERTYRATARLGAWPDEEIPVPEVLAESLLAAVRASKEPENEEDAGDTITVPPKPV